MPRSSGSITSNQVCVHMWGRGGQSLVLKVRWQAEDSIHLGGTCFCVGHPSKPFGPIKGKNSLPLWSLNFNVGGVSV